MLTVNYSILNLSPGDLTLDLGCGGGRHTFEALRTGASVISLDTDEQVLKPVVDMVKAMRYEGEIDQHTGYGAVNGNALSLPFRDQTFDQIIASEVLEHIWDDMQALHELKRVLKPGGILAVTVPRFGPELINWRLAKAYHRQPGGHVRIYTKLVLKDRLERSGLRPVTHHYAHGLHSPYWWIRCLVGPSDNNHPLVSTYHRLLVWDIYKHPWPTRLAEKLLAPLIGKSMVVYATKDR